MMVISLTEGLTGCDYIQYIPLHMFAVSNNYTHIGRLQGQIEGGSRLIGRKDDSAPGLHEETAEDNLQLL